MTTTLSSRQFNQDTGGAKRAAQAGPVFITDRGRTAHVLLTIDEYRRLKRDRLDMIELIGAPPGAEDIDLEIPPRTDHPREFDFE